MKKIIPLFAISNDYKEEVKQYNHKDILLAVILFLAYIGAMLFMGYLDNNKTITGVSLMICGIGINILFSLITIVFVLIRKQGLETIGLIQGRYQLSLILGGILALILFTCNCILNVILEDAIFKNIGVVVILFFYYLSVAFVEEIMFRGYMLTRFYALTSNCFISMIMTGLLFVLMHFPYRMMIGINFMDLITNYSYLIDLFITHCVLSYIYMKSKSLYGSILSHWMSDFGYGILIH